MGELVAKALLSSVFKTLFEKLGSEEFREFFGGQKRIAELLDELNTVLMSANKLLNDAEEKQVKDDLVRDWLHKLKEAVYEADDLVDTIDSAVLRRKEERDQSRKGSTNNNSMVKAMKKINISANNWIGGIGNKVKNQTAGILSKLKSLLDQKDNLGLREGVERLVPSRRPPAPLVEESGVYGRKGDKDAIVNLLLSGDDGGNEICVIPIVGMGGIGKTTLAQLVYDDRRVVEHFEMRAWEAVSDDFDISKITRVILEKVSSEKCGTEDFFEIQQKLKAVLRGKRFLFVLDDVWNESCLLWESLKSSFVSGTSESKIIVTARNNIVASVMAPRKTPYQLTDLSSEDCWRLFSRHAFGNNTNSQAFGDLEPIGKEIVRKCKGLPLAVKSIGALLGLEHNPVKWKSILKSDVWAELYRKESNDILPALWLSYRHLPTHLKRCFAYCSIFPKNHEFEKHNTTMLWMAEGFLRPDNRSTAMEELGEQCFDDLLSRTLFQRSSRDGLVFTMHDLIHDLAMFVAGEFCFRLDCGDGDDNNSCGLKSRTRHLSYNRDRYDWNNPDGFDPKLLRTFVGLPLVSWARAPVPHDLLLRKGRRLRVLSLHHSHLKELPDSIGNLIHLRYLNLSHCDIKELPESFCTLYKLQTLLLSGCSILVSLPENMENLINLRHLDVEGVPLRDMSFRVGNMKSLQTLNKVVLGKTKINELKDVHPFQGRLEISRLDTVNNAAEAMEACMKEKKCIKVLSLTWSHADGGRGSAPEKEREILDSLQPHNNLRNLAIKSYRGRLFSKWIGHGSYRDLESIRLENCDSCLSLPPMLGELPSLKELVIAGLGSVAKMSGEFRSLERLVMWDMSELKDWSLGTNEGPFLLFPCLTKLSLYRCPKLKIQPRIVFPLLVSLDMSDCDRLLKSWDIGGLSKLERLDVSGWKGRSFPVVPVSLPLSLTRVTIANCENLVALNDSAFQQLALLEWVSVIDCPNLRQCPPSLARFQILPCPSSNTSIADTDPVSKVFSWLFG